MRTVEGLLEKGLIEVANKEAELKVMSVFGKKQAYFFISEQFNMVRFCFLKCTSLVTFFPLNSRL